MALYYRTDIATRAIIIALKSLVGGKTTAKLVKKLGLLKSTINSIYARVIERGFDPNYQPLKIRDKILKDSPRPSRPKKQIDEVKEAIISKV
jgi:transposase